MQGPTTLAVGVSFILCAVLCAAGVGPEDGNVSPAALKHEYAYVSKKVQTIALNINRYLDVLVMVVREGLNNIDPYPLPDVVETFDEKVWILSLNGQFLMKNGIIHNLNTISRRGNATLRYDNMKLYIDTEFVFDLIIFDYSIVTEIASLGPRGYLSGHARDLVFHSVLVYDVQTERLGLHQLELIEKGDVKVNVMVSKMVDWLANPVINWLATLYEEKLLIMLRNALRKIVGEHLPPEEILFIEKP